MSCHRPKPAQRYRAMNSMTLLTHAVTPRSGQLPRALGNVAAARRRRRSAADAVAEGSHLAAGSSAVSADFVHDGAQLAGLEMLRSGTTTCSDMYFYPEACMRALRSLGMRVVAGIVAIEFPTAYAAGCGRLSAQRAGDA